MWGEYYVFCTHCSVKVFNTDANYDPSIGWICKDHKEDRTTDKNLNIPRENIYRPAITKRPQVNNFGNASHNTWEVISLTWDTITTNWEDL